MKKQIRFLLLFSTIAFCLSGCVKSFTDNEDTLVSIGDNNELGTRLYPIINANGDTLKVADSGYRNINGVPTFVATGKPRIVMHEAQDSVMRVWPSFAVVKGWLKARGYYSTWLPTSIICYILAVLCIFVFPKFIYKNAVKFTGWGIFALASIFFYLSYESAGRTARVTSEQNSKTVPIEEYRKQKEKDNFSSFWDSLRVNNRITYK